MYNSYVYGVHLFSFQCPPVNLFYVLHTHLCPVFKVLAMTVQGSYPIFLGLAARKIGGQHLVKAGQEISLWAVGSVLIVNGLWNAGLFGLHIQDLLGKQDVENAQYFHRTRVS
jgi:hypothetical protein